MNYNVTGCVRRQQYTDAADEYAVIDDRQPRVEMLVKRSRLDNCVSIFDAVGAENRDIAQHAVRCGSNTDDTNNTDSRRVYRMTNSRSADAVFTGMVTV